MIVEAGIFALVLFLVVVTCERRVDRISHEAAQERRKLLDRIQHPEVRQIEPGPVIDHEPPADAAELAYVGQVVPEFINVGGDDG